MADAQQTDQQSLDDSSIDYLKQQAIIILENECIALEKEYERKKADNAALRATIATQDKNNLRMQAEAEQFRVKIQKEIMGRTACEAKLSTLNKECQDLEKNLSEYCKGANRLLQTIQHQKDILKQKAVASKENEARIDRIEENYQKVLLHVSQTAEEMSKLKTYEKEQFDVVISHLKSEIKDKKEQESLLKEQFRQVDSRCKETEIKIKMLMPQKIELENMADAIKSEMERQRESFEKEDGSLKAALQEEAEKRTKLTEQISNIEKNIQETNSNIREKENEVRDLQAKMKQLICENDELDQSKKKDVEEINNLAQEVEEKTKSYALLAAVQEENALLIKERDSLQEINAELEEKINYKKKEVETNGILIQEIDESILKTERERDQIINENLAIEEGVRHKEFQISKIKIEHEENCAKLDKEYINLCQKNEELKRTNDEKAKLFSSFEKQKEMLQSELSGLQLQLNASKKKHDDSFDEYLNNMREKEAVVKQLREEIEMLEVATGLSAKQAKKALEDSEEYEAVNKRIDQLERQLESLQIEHDSLMEQTEEEHNKKIEEKRVQFKTLQDQKQSEYSRQEVAKSDARIELRENQRFIEDLVKSKELTQKEIKKTEINVKKCEKLVKALEDKLAKVARVASNSQTTANSQVSNLLSTPRYNRPQPIVQNSPPSDSSSGVTINPDDAFVFGGARKRQMMKKPDSDKNIKKADPKRKPKKYEDDDDWKL